MSDYTVRYHPEGWRDAKTEPPTESGDYIVALKYMAADDEYAGEGFVTILQYDEDVKLWGNAFKSLQFNQLDLDLMCYLYKLVAWQPLPTPPWEIMPKGEE